MKNLIFVFLLFIGCISEPKIQSENVMVFSGTWHDYFVTDSTPMKMVFTNLTANNFDGILILHNYFQASNSVFVDSARMTGHALRENTFFIDSLYRYHYTYNGTANNTITFNADKTELVYITDGNLDTIILKRE